MTLILSLNLGNQSPASRPFLFLLPTPPPTPESSLVPEVLTRWYSNFPAFLVSFLWISSSTLLTFFTKAFLAQKAHAFSMMEAGVNPIWPC